ncbi:MAG: hypothetical protein V3S55_09995 [Nitrospiraceae bacterium]
MNRTIRSWDRKAIPPGNEFFDGNTSPLNSPYISPNNVPVRVVVWSKDAPDPSTVPHAGERVTWRDSTVYEVVNGIPEWGSYHDEWRLWVKNVTSGESQHPAIEDLTVHEDPPRTYTEAEIRAAFEGKSYRYEDSIIKALREGS